MISVKVGKKSEGMPAVENLGINTQNDKDDMLARLAERNNLMIMN